MPDAHSLTKHIVRERKHHIWKGVFQIARKTSSVGRSGEEAQNGVEYVADWVNDDQPYEMTLEAGRSILSVPYSHEINDKPAFEHSHRTADEFKDMICRQFDVLYREGAESGRVMAIALHPYLTGVPHRIDALDAALAYIGNHARLWKATGAEILSHLRARPGGLDGVRIAVQRDG